jgi:hypothetical protein
MIYEVNQVKTANISEGIEQGLFKKKKGVAMSHSLISL